MNELIHITTDEQGLSRVESARELHGFLEVKSRFADWFKNRATKYGFVEGKDYVTLSKDLETQGFTKNLEKGGRPEMDYALTLNMAKELSMVERNDKGKQARQYFIQAEETLRQIVTQPAPAPPISPTEQVLIQLVSQTNQIMTNQAELLSQLRADVDGIMQGHKPPRPGRPGKQLQLPGTGLALPPRGRGLGSLRQLIHNRVTDYCAYHEASSQETYNYLYKRMLDVYGVNVYRLIRAAGESLLDALERYGHLDRLYSLIMAELTYSEE